MKVSTKHLAMLRDALSGESTGTTERDRWDALWRVIDSERLDFHEFWDYKDDHIDTALRTIQREKAK